MRRVTCPAVMILCFLSVSLYAPLAARSASMGQPVGRIYESDILAFVDGMPIDSCNIGGQTVVVCEGLEDYGFLVSWHQDARVLNVETSGMPERAPVWSGARGKPGGVAGTVYATDIVTYINGRKVPSYNIGGRTVVAIEDLGIPRASPPPKDPRGFSGYGFTFTWDAAERTISLFSLRPGSEIACDVGDCTSSGLIATGQLGYGVQQHPLRLDGKTLEGGVTTVTVPVGNVYLEWIETARALGVAWRWSPEEGALLLGSAEFSPAKPASGEVTEEALLDAEHWLRSICGVKIDIRIGGQAVEAPRDWRYVPAEAVIHEGKLYVRIDAIAAALDLILVQDDGFYRKTDSPLCWDHTFTPYTGGHDEWVLSATPSYFGAGRGMIGIMTHDRTAPITLTFSRPMDETTLNPENVVVICKTSRQDGRVEYKTISDLYRYAYERASHTLTLTPSGTSELPVDTAVTVAIRPSIADMEGNHPPGGMKIGFRVGP